MPVKYDQETKARAIRLVREHAGDYPSEYAAITAVARRLGMTAETLRKWIRQAEIDEGQAPGVTQGRDIQASFQLPAAAPVALAQLPTATAGFTGRDDELAVLAGLLDPAGAAGPVVVSAVAGLAGVGKTTLAVEAGHAARQRGWFGGGVLFIDLHGYDEAPVEPGQALDALLRARACPPSTSRPPLGSGPGCTGPCSPRSPGRCW